MALQHITGSVWSVGMRRVAEMFAAPMWLMALLFIPLLVFALSNKDLGVFAWLRPDEAKAAHLPNTHTLDAKAPYLNQNFFLIRTVLFFVIWAGFAAFYVRGSLKQDDGSAGPEKTSKMKAVSGPFMIIFAFTLTFAAFDWLMALRPDWFSTIYGVYVFAGVVLSGLAAITITVCGLRNSGALPKDLIKRDHLYSLGALLFAFTCFWGYMSLSQFILIWYANMPEETTYYVDRIQGGWLAVTWGIQILRFALPFLLLLSRDQKMNPRRLIAVSLLILAGQAFDAYWLIMPEVPGQAGAMPAWQDFGPIALLTGVLLMYVGIFQGKHKLVPAGDPNYEASKHFHL